MDYAPLDPAMLARIKRKEKRRTLPAVDWDRVAAADDWISVPMTVTDSSDGEWLREFYRLRKQARTWSSRNNIQIRVRRDLGSRQVFARVVGQETK